MLALFARSQSENSRVTALLRDGQSALDAGDFSRAVQDFENARQLAPDMVGRIDHDFSPNGTS